MMKFFLPVGLAIAVSTANAHEITSCRSQDGATVSPLNGMSSGSGPVWVDGIDPNALLTLTQNEDGAFDILFTDARDALFSLNRNGAEVRTLRVSPNEIDLIARLREGGSVLVSFFVDKQGASRYALIPNRSGSASAIIKGALIVGACDPIRFDLLF